MEKQRIRNIGGGCFTNRPISIHLNRNNYGIWNAEFPEGNLDTYGHDNIAYTKEVAVDNIKSLILCFYKGLSSKRKEDLGSGLQKKKDFLEDLIEKNN